jgi:hypothetical protein
LVCFRKAVFISLASFLFTAAAALAASDAPETPARFSYSIDARNFTVTRDAVKLEAPQDGMLRVAPRARGSVVWTHFPLPEESRGHREWIVTASVGASAGAGGGVGMWYDDGGYVLLLFPDGNGYMRYYDGKSVLWSAEVKAANFAWPARLSLVRDVNGSVTGRVDDAIVGARLLPVDLKRRALPKVKSLSFVTQNLPGTNSGYALYEKLDAEAYGAK